MTNTQLVILYDENPDITVEMLAENFGYELEAVKMVLSSSSSRFRKEMRKEESVFTDGDFDLAKRTMVSLMKESEVDAVKYRAATFVINEHLGRNKLENAKSLGHNINIVNVHVQKGRAALELSKSQKPVIDVETAKQLREANVEEVAA
jgi:hypothetical protein